MEVFTPYQLKFENDETKLPFGTTEQDRPFLTEVVVENRLSKSNSQDKQARKKRKKKNRVSREDKFFLLKEFMQIKPRKSRMRRKLLKKTKPKKGEALEGKGNDFEDELVIRF